MRVFLDTNVLASATATRGLCADVLREVFAHHDLFVSTLVLEELKNVLVKKFGVGQRLAGDAVRLLRRDSILARPKSAFSVALKDKDDIPILSAAVSAEAEVFVTGDKKLPALGRVESLEILSPREFWEKLRTERRDEGRRGKRRR